MVVRNHEVLCDPIPAADVPGFRFTRNQNGVIVARCTTCLIGFVVREENAERVRFAMGAHQDWEHGSHLSRAALRSSITAGKRSAQSGPLRVKQRTQGHPAHITGSRRV